jgi:receptor-type tyrosine-protein phosphatase A
MATLLKMSGEFEKLEFSRCNPNLCSISSQNEMKNRYNNILAPDSTIVTIPEISYINANYITLSDKRQMIACQAPLSSTQDDFWKMVYYTKCKCILMVTALFENNKEKCSNYWPDEFEPKRFFGNIEVTIDESWKVNPDLIVSSLHVEGPCGIIKVHHIFYTAWRDHAVIDCEDVIFLLSIVESFITDDEVFVCHCSAGIGRTGVIAAVLRSFLSNEPAIKAIVNIRSQRHCMVQTRKQYELVKTVIDYVLF